MMRRMISKMDKRLAPKNKGRGINTSPVGQKREKTKVKGLTNFTFVIGNIENKPELATMRPDCVSAYIDHVTHMD